MRLPLALMAVLVASPAFAQYLPDRIQGPVVTRPAPVDCSMGTLIRGCNKVGEPFSTSQYVPTTDCAQQGRRCRPGKFKGTGLYNPNKRSDLGSFRVAAPGKRGACAVLYGTKHARTRC